jgi:hypothetical protein
MVDQLVEQVGTHAHLLLRGTRRDFGSMSSSAGKGADSGVATNCGATDADATSGRTGHLGRWLVDSRRNVHSCFGFGHGLSAARASNTCTS